MIKEVFELGDDLFLANRVSERVPLLQVVIGQNAIVETDACSRMTQMDSKTARFCRTVFQCSGAQGINLMRKQSGGFQQGQTKEVARTHLEDFEFTPNATGSAISPLQTNEKRGPGKERKERGTMTGDE